MAQSCLREERLLLSSHGFHVSVSESAVNVGLQFVGVGDAEI
jgi:hypothetical protein